MDGNQVINGTYGAAFINGDRFFNVKEFEAKVSLNFEDIQLAEELGTDAKYLGYNIEGTMLLHKVDDKIARHYAEGITTGVLPDITVVTRLKDPAVAGGAERVQLNGVKFTELTLAKWKLGEAQEEEVPFRARSYKYLEMI